MTKKLYAGNLPHALTDDSLKELFSAHGNVESAKIIMDMATGRSKGFGFVEMVTEEEANAAIEALNRTEVDGRTINVSQARPRENRNSRGPRPGGGGGGNGGGGFRRY